MVIKNLVIIQSFNIQLITKGKLVALVQEISTCMLIQMAMLMLVHFVKIRPVIVFQIQLIIQFLK